LQDARALALLERDRGRDSVARDLAVADGDGRPALETGVGAISTPPPRASKSTIGMAVVRPPVIFTLEIRTAGASCRATCRR